MAYRNYSTAEGHIVDPAGNGDYTTIQAAITAASAGQTIFIRPGTYTENLTLKAGVYLTAFTGDATGTGTGTPTVQITGKASFTAAGTVNISNIQFNTNSDFCLAVTGSADSILNLTNCFINCSNNVGISYTSSSANSRITCNNCFSAVTATFALYTATGAGQINFIYCVLNNNSTAASSTSACTIVFYHCQVYLVLSTSSIGSIAIKFSYCDTTLTNTTFITTAGTGGATIFNSVLKSGTASVISAGSGTVITISQSSVNSSNANAITGAGTIQIGNVVFDGSSSTVNTTTKTLINSYTRLSTNQPSFLAYLDPTVSNVTGDNTLYTIVFDHILFDIGSNFNTSTGVFTAPFTGKYQLNFAVSASNQNAGGIVFSRLVTTAATFNGGRVDNNLVNQNNCVTGSFVVNMTAGDTASVQLAITGSGSKNCGVLGGTSPYGSTFSGYFLG